MKRVLYFIHVPWSWIKQRPQFLAEALTSYYNVTVVNIDIIGKREKSEIQGLNIVNIYRLPFERFKIISLLSKFLISLQLSLLKKNYDIVWVTSPSLLNISKPFFKDKCVVYDCMDDMLAFTDDINKKAKIFDAEKELYYRSNLLISSASYLKQQLSKRYGEKAGIVVNNAITTKIIQPAVSENPEIENLFNADYFNITYIGTIAEWFDFELLNIILDKYRNVRFHLFGPSVVEIPLNERICHHGPIPHKHVGAAMWSSDALIMPFVVNDLIQSVNPVKLYEYIAAGKPTLAPKYGESLPFNEHIFLYNDRSHCIDLISKILNGATIKPFEERKRFLMENTWDMRASVIHSEIEKLLVK